MFTDLLFDFANLAINTHTGAYNVCSGEGITVQSFAEKIADEFDAMECDELQIPCSKDLDMEWANESENIQ